MSISAQQLLAPLDRTESMGNTAAKGPDDEAAPPPLGPSGAAADAAAPTVAMANRLAWQTKVSKAQVLELQRTFAAHASQSPGETELQLAQLRALLADADSTTPTALRLPNSSEFFLQRMFAVFDASRSSTLNFQEFLMGLSICSEGSAAEKFELSFRIFDVDGTGAIGRHEMKRVLTIMDRQAEELRRGGGADNALSEEECGARAVKVAATVGEIFDSADVTRNGLLTFPEYLKGVLKFPGLVDFDILGGAEASAARAGGSSDASAAPLSILEQMESHPLEEAMAVLGRAFKGVAIEAASSAAPDGASAAPDAALLVLYDDATPARRVVRIVDRR